MRLKARRDLTEDAIRKGLEVAGYSVIAISQGGLLDLLVCKDGNAWLVECKSKGGKLTPRQKAFIDSWTGCPVIVAKTLEETLDKIGYNRD